MTCTFKRDTSSEDLLESIKSITEEMIEARLWCEKTTFEDMAAYAGSHVLITEKKECDHSWMKKS